MNNKLDFNTAKPLLLKLSGIVHKRRSLTQALDALIAILPEQGDSLPLASVLSALFPDKDTKHALERLRDIRRHWHKEADDAGLQFRFEVDGQKKLPPEQRSCWITGESMKQDQIAAFFSQEGPVDSDIQVTDIRATVDERVNGKQLIRLYIDYADQDAQLAADFIDKLTVSMEGSSQNYAFHLSSALDVVAGQYPDKQREQRIQQANIILTLISLHYLNHKLEDQQLANKRNAIMPVQLSDFDGKHREMGWLQDRAVFRHIDSKQQASCFQSLNQQKRKQYIEQLREQIITLLNPKDHAERLSKMIEKYQQHYPPEADNVLESLAIP
ncbi:MAG: hypothetical protein V3V22_00220, partial [Methylococcales bacterium]